MSNSSESNARQIAALLMQILHLPKDDSLVPSFGTGQETNNLDAITLWVECHLHEIDDSDATLRRLQSRTRLISQKRGDHASM